MYPHHQASTDFGISLSHDNMSYWSPTKFYSYTIGLRMHSITWNPFPISKICWWIKFSLLGGTSYLNKNICKFESAQSAENIETSQMIPRKLVRLQKGSVTVEFLTIMDLPTKYKKDW